MKRFLFLSALASVALAGCVNDETMEVTSQASDQKITFNAPIVGGMTRAVAGEQPLTNTKKYSTAEKFRVYAQWDKDGSFENWVTANSDASLIYMNDIEVAYDGNVENGAWTPEAVTGQNAYYWPKNGVLTFAAYSPSEVNSFVHSYTDEGLKVENFTVKDKTSEQYDFMYSTRSKDRTSNANWLENTPEGEHTYKSFNGVDILFKHALSSIKFKVKTEENYVGTTVRIKQVTILNAFSQGTFAESSQATQAAWSNRTNAKNYTVKTDATNQVVTSDVASLADANDVILLPQALKHEDGNGNVKVKIDYSIEHENTGLELVQSLDVDLAVGNSGSYYKDQATSADIEAWEMGKRYTYTIIIGLERIRFSPEVTYWDDVYVTPDLKF